MAEAAAMSTAAEASAWVGAPLSDLGGAAIGEVAGLYVDEPGGEPVWLVARLGRRRRSRVVVVPMVGCAGAPFGAWAAYEAETIASAPIVDPGRPLRREHELTICAHFGIGESVGRAAAVTGREAEAVTAVPLRP